MKKQIRYDSVIYIDRNELHRELRNALNEQNLPEEYRIHLEMLEDLYASAATAAMLMETIENEKKGIRPSERVLETCRESVLSSEALLEKWEQKLLRR